MSRADLVLVRGDDRCICTITGGSHAVCCPLWPRPRVEALPPVPLAVTLEENFREELQVLLTRYAAMGLHMCVVATAEEK